MIEIIAHRSGLTGRHQRFGRTVAESGNRLGRISRHRLLLAARPQRDPSDDLQHLPDPALALRRVCVSYFVQSLTTKPNCLGKLAFGHAETRSDLLYGDMPAVVDEAENWAHARIDLEMPASTCHQPAPAVGGLPRLELLFARLGHCPFL